MSQRRIDAAHRRSLKKTYRGLSPNEKRIVKASEDYEQLDKSITRTYRIGETKFGKGFRKDARFQSDFTQIGVWERRKEKLRKRIARLEAKHGLDEDKVIQKFNQLNTCRLYGGSF